jgi:DNA-directed RNA polymerase subunit RPC12/RpoP
MKISRIMERPLEEEARCLACLTRFWPKQGAEKAKCPGCGVEWRISWPYPRTAKIGGPGWETYPTGDKI